MSQVLATTEDNYLIDFNTQDNVISIPYAISPDLELDEDFAKIKNFAFNEGRHLGSPDLLNFFLSQTPEPLNSSLYKSIEEIKSLYPANSFALGMAWDNEEHCYVERKHLRICLPQVVDAIIDSSTPQIDLIAYEAYLIAIDKIDTSSRQVSRFNKKLNSLCNSINGVSAQIKKKYPNFKFNFPSDIKGKIINFDYLNSQFKLKEIDAQELEYWTQTLEDTTSLKRRSISINPLNSSLERLYNAPHITGEGFLICEASPKGLGVLCVDDDGSYYLSTNAIDAVGVFSSAIAAITLVSDDYDRKTDFLYLYIAHYKKQRLVALLYGGLKRSDDSDFQKFNSSLQSRFEKLAMENTLVAMSEDTKTLKNKSKI